MALEEGCPLCGEVQFATKYVLTDENYKAVQCKSCSFVSMHPYPSDDFLSEHYKSRELYGFYGDHAEHYDRAIKDRGGLISNLLDENEASFRNGYAVDLGAGIGIAVSAMKNIGFDAIGLEANPNSPEIAKRLFEVEVLNKDLENIPGNIKLLTVFEVLEHIKYPINFIASVRDKLGDGAFMIGSVPNYNGVGRYLHGNKSIALAWPEHVNQFTKASLNRTLTAGGLEVMYIGFPPPYGVSLTAGVRKFLSRRFGHNASINTLIKALTNVKKYLVYPLLNLFAERTGLLGHGLVFAARRSSPSLLPAC